MRESNLILLYCLLETLSEAVVLPEVAQLHPSLIKNQRQRTGEVRNILRGCRDTNMRPLAPVSPTDGSNWALEHSGQSDEQ